jgi:hypothetical protein
MNEDLNRNSAERAHENLAQFTRLNYGAAFASGQLVLRTIFFSNFSAMVAVLFFLSTIAGKVSVAEISIISSSLIWFVAGITAGLTALTCAYLANLYDAYVATSVTPTWEYPYNKPGPTTHYYLRIARLVDSLAIMAGAVSLLFFIIGMWDVRSAIILLGK